MNDSVPETYRVHPLLDPFLPSRQPALARFWLTAYRRGAQDARHHGHVLDACFEPIDGPQAISQPIEAYLRDADAYLDDLLRLIRAEDATRLGPSDRCRKTNDLASLLRMMFEGADPRTRYEAQRKLQLCRMLSDIDHSRPVRDGALHRERLERLLERHLWTEVERVSEMVVCCELAPDRRGLARMLPGRSDSDESVCIRFPIRQLAATATEPAIRIYHYHSRFKRERLNVSLVPSDDPGIYSLGEAFRWPGLGRRSGSILSKMIRRAIGDPQAVPDLLGAMFIVGDAGQAHALERRLQRPFGGPFRWRDRVDTLSGDADRTRLGPQAAAGFRVLKSIVDILIEDPTASYPYLFATEIQIYPLEQYMHTLFDAEHVGHDAYKRRQFLNDILPLLFPVEIYGPPPGPSPVRPPGVPGSSASSPGRTDGGG